MAADRGCPSHETLASFLLGKLPAEQEEAVTSHLETCAACEARAQQLEQEADPVIAALRQPPTPPLFALDDATLRTTPEATSAGPPFHLEGYRILEEIGRGGMGVVYRAYQHRLNRLVAIKMILGGHLVGAEERVRFLMEGELLARLNHPNFVQVYEVGTIEPLPGTVQPYLVLEHVEGSCLKARLMDRPLPFREAARLALVLARAMETAHAQGIVHRDLKPANVLVARDGTLKITDFGLAKELGTGTSLTPTGLALGTPGYMAPEQARAHAHIGPATDVYALGAVLYEMLTGRAPFTGEVAVEVMLQVLENTPAPASRLRAGVPRDLETICLKCLEKEPRARYARAAELADDLERWLENRPIRARPAGWTERAVKWARRHPLPAALLAFLALSVVLGSAASTYFGVTATDRANEAQEALAKEAEARQLAEQAAEAERWERYKAEIAGAANALQLHNIDLARRCLEAAPPGYRNWEWHHFHSQLDGARSVLRGHTGRVWAVAFSPDGKRLTSVAHDHTLRWWDISTGKEIKALPIAGGDIRFARFSPDGSRLATVTTVLQVWDAATGRLCWEAAAPANVKGLGLNVVWSPDARHLAAGGADGLLHVWDVVTGRELFAKPCNMYRYPVAFSPDGRHVATAEMDFTVHVWEVATGAETVVLRGHEDTCTAISYSPDGQRIATGSIFRENQVRLWNAATGAQLGVGTGHDNEVNVLVFSPDGRRLASGSMDQTVRLWDGFTCRPLARLEGHTNLVQHLAFSPDGARLVSASMDQTLRLWDPAAGRLLAVLRGHGSDILAVCYGPSGALIASASDDHTVRLWDTELAARDGVLRGHTQYVYDVAFRPAGGELASAAWDGKVILWDLATGRASDALDHPADAVLPALAYSPDSRQLAVVLSDKGVWLWDLARRKPHPLWTDRATAIKSDARIAFQPHGTLLALGTTDGVRLWDLARGVEAKVLAEAEGTFRDLAFRPDGKQLATVTQDGTVCLWDLATYRQEAVLHGSPDAYRLAYSADGRLLAAGSKDKTVRLWAVATRQEIGKLRLGGAVYGLAFNPDGTRLACSCADNTIRLLDVARLQEVAELRGHADYVHAVQFSPDGTRLASASGDKTVRLWDTLPLQDRAGAAAHP
jgi:WD40 repeat protein